METSNCIETRRSIRRFSDTPIEKMLIEKLVVEAQYAPTWKNSQTTRFTVITDKSVLNEICSALPSYNAAIVQSSPLLMAVSAVTQRAGYERDGTPSTDLGEAYTFFDCGATVQTFCLAANNENVATVILGIFESQKIKDILAIPQNEELVVLVACGYKTADAQMPPRRELAEVLKFK